MVDVSKYLLSPGAALNMDENNAGGAGSHKTGKTQAETIRGMMKTGRESTDGLVSNRDYQHKPGR